MRTVITMTAFLLCFGAATAIAQAVDVRMVGFEKILIDNGSETPLQGGIWYPTSGRSAAQGNRPGVVSNAPVQGDHLPLIVLSHGGGGSYEGHHDTAIALAQAGFVVAAINHSGDSYDGESKVLQLWRRPKQLHTLISYMLGKWSERRILDHKKVGAFGFSNGGFTVLVAAGGIPDLTRIGAYCQAHRDHDLCTAMRRAGIDPRNLPIREPRDAWISDVRIKAIVAAAPAFGFTFDKQGLKNARIPIQIWRAKNDRHQPTPYYEEAVRAALSVPPEYHVVPAAGHYDFLPPCDKRLAAAKPEICSSASGFDRAAFHAEFNVKVVEFFRAHLVD
ncbi:MAG TPA: alpha/beta fold hydrolase [Terriglobales bacterium]|nr:alpha/beta fold hydrolase [Terriglobales bacterium]